MQQQPLRVGLVGIKDDGVSAMHQNSIAALEAEGLVKLVAVAETDQERNKEILARLKEKGVRIYSDCESMAMTAGLDAVTIATPHFTHVPISMKFLNNETAVFLEKPPAVTVQSGLGLSQMYNSGAGLIGVNYMYTASQSAHELRQALIDGALGDIEKIVCIGKWMRSNEYFQGRSWAGKKMVGDQACLDGCLLNQFPHVLNQAAFFASLGKDVHPEKVQAELYRGHRKEVLEMEDTASLKARVNGIDILLYCTTCHDQDDPISLMIYGTRGIAKWDFTHKDTGYGISFDEGKEWHVKKRCQEDWPKMCLGMYRNFIDALREDFRLYWNIDQSLATTAIVNGAYISSGGITQIPSEYMREIASEGGGESAGLKTSGKQTKVLFPPEIMEGFDLVSRKGVMLSETGLAHYMPVERPPATEVDLRHLRCLDLKLIN